MPGTAAPAAPAAPSPAPAAAGVCPSCGTPRADASARFCEVCRYDYQTQSPGPPPVVEEAAPPAPAAAPAPPASPDAPPPAPAAPRGPTGRADWEVTIVLDPSLDDEPDPGAPPPPNIGDRIFPIDLPEMLVGRRD